MRNLPTPVFIFFIILFIHFSAKSQDTISGSIREVFKSRHNFEATISHGFIRPEINHLSGPHKAYPITGRVFDASFGYTFNFSERLGISGAGSLGAYPGILGIPETTVSHGMDYSDYFHYVDYGPFTELATKVTFRSFLSNRFAINTNIGFGAKFPQASHFSSSFGSFDDSNIVSSYELNTKSGPAPFLLLQPTLLYKLKNSDLIGLNFSYRHSFKDIQNGTYEIATNTPEYSYGEFRVKGHQLTVGLSYIFTGFEKYKRAAEAGPGKSKREIKRQYRQEYYSKRLEKNSAIRVYGAIFADQNTSTDPYKIIINTRPPSLGAGIDFIRGFKPNFFWEVGANFHEYWEGSGFNIASLITSTAGNAFNAVQLSAGGGYTFRNKRLTPIINLSAGAALVFNTDGDTKGHVASSWMTMDSPGRPYYLDYRAEHYILKTAFPLLYVGARKDIRIRGRLFLSPEFKYYQGLTKIYETKVQYTLNEIAPEYRNTTVFMRGSYFHYGLGLKFDL